MRHPAEIDVDQRLDHFPGSRVDLRPERNAIDVLRLRHIRRRNFDRRQQTVDKRDDGEAECCLLTADGFGEHLLAKLLLVGRGQRGRLVVGVAHMPAVAIDGDSLEQAFIALRQPEVPPQEGLGVAPAKEVVVPTERLVQKAAEAVEHAARNGELLGRRRAVPDPGWRDHEA